jgi:hypothetical protein
MAAGTAESVFGQRALSASYRLLGVRSGPDKPKECFGSLHTHRMRIPLNSTHLIKYIHSALIITYTLVSIS